MTTEEYDDPTYDPPRVSNGSEALLSRGSIMHGVLKMLKREMRVLLGGHIAPGAED